GISRSGCDSFLGKPVGKDDLIIELMHFLPYSTSTGSNDGLTQLTQPLSPQVREKLPGLIHILQADDLTLRLEMLSRGLVLDEVEGFLMDMKELDRTYQSGILTGWADRLFSDLGSFDLDKIQQTLSYFPQLIEEIKDLAGGMK
ncbi:MAG: hypothetical protein GY940_12910, partial [bacterium]|nr:hypothetical protein [bacterium]